MDAARPGLISAPRAWWAVAALIPAAFLAVFFVWPVGTLLSMGFDVHAFADVASDGRLRQIVWFTCWQAGASTLLTLAVGLPAAWALARFELPGRRAMRAALVVPFVLPTVVVGAAFVAVLGPGGPLHGLHLDGTVWAVLASHVFFNVAVVVRLVGGHWAHLDRRQEEAARVLGASCWRAFREVTLPRLSPAVVGAGALVFLFCFTAFGTVLILGGPRRSTLEVEIWRQTAQLLDLRIAAALSMIQLVAVAALVVLQRKLAGAGGGAEPLQGEDETARRIRGWRDRLAVTAAIVPLAIFLAGPLAVLVRRSVDTPSGLGLDWYRALGHSSSTSALFVPPRDAIANSLWFALLATVIALGVGLPAAALVARRRGRSVRLLDVALMLPLGVSAVTVGFGFLVALDEPPLDLRTSRLLIPVAHALVAVPFVVRIVVPALRAVDPRLREAAATLGAQPRRVWREVDLPLVAGAVLGAAGFAFAVSLGEFGATLFIARPDSPTLPIAIFRFLGQPGVANHGQAMALSTVLMVVTAAAVAGIDRLRTGETGAF